MLNDEISRQHHYVPVWYQKGFAIGGLLHYLDLDPRTLTLPDGRLVRLLDRKPRAPKSCFWELDLYTTRFGNAISDEIEKLLFGSIDDGGARALRGLAVGDERAIHRGFQDMFSYLGAQKLRTPKGLDWIRAKYPGLTQLELMSEMQYLRQMYGTMWLESVREVVSAERSDVKFIVTDHPVTVYNPACEPGSQLCGYPNDPSIALAGTQTVFAIDADHLLVLTNLEYAKDPAGVDLLAPRQNARFFGQTIARTDAWIRTRHLSRDQIRSVNFLLKSRARRYVAAGKKEWLHPEAAGPVQWRDVGVALLPPDDELFHFGGEMYFGYKDGTSGCQDAYGRTTGAHEFLERPEVRSPGPNDRCGCGSGWKFRRCCAGAPAHERPSWRLLSIRERNLGLVNAITDVLGLNNGKTWSDVRRELGDEQVRRIHEVYSAFWPPDTNIMELLPRAAHGASSRAVYMGFVDPRTLPKTVTSWLAYFDQIVVVNPFTNPAYMKPEFSPIESPAQYKEQTLKNCVVLLALAQFIDAGTVLLVPDPCEFDPAFREAVIAMAKERARGWQPKPEDMAVGEQLLRDDYARSLRRLPESSLRRLLENAPGVNDENIDLVIQHMKRQHEEDPLALLQPLETGKRRGQMQVLRGVSVELGLFLAQLTGAFIYTDVPAVWQQLHAHATSRQPTPSSWAPALASLERVPFTLELNPRFVAEAGGSLRLRHLRAAIRQLWKAARDGKPENSERLSRILLRASERAQGAWDGEPSVEPSAQIDQYLQLSVPEGGFGRNAVRRLLVLSGRSSYLPAVPIAMLMKERQRRQPSA